MIINQARVSPKNIYPLVFLIKDVYYRELKD